MHGRMSTRWACFFAIVMMAVGMMSSGAARAQQLLADLSSHHVAINTSFVGTKVIIFGAIEGKGDVVVAVFGPKEQIAVRRKSRVLGMWMNTESVLFDGVPNFYAVSASRPLEEIAGTALLASEQIGADYLRFDLIDGGDSLSDQEKRDFETAIVRRKQARGVYSEEVGDISVMLGRLFRTEIEFPANLPTGRYTAVVYLIRDGSLVQAQTTPLVVEKVGFDAFVFDAAQHQSWLYGVAAIFIAIGSGWLAASIFRNI